MTKFNVKTAAPRVKTPVAFPQSTFVAGGIQAASQPVVVIPSDTTTYNGAEGWTRTAQGELFLLAVSNLGSGTFYESATDRDVRFRDLVQKVTLQDPDWTLRFITWLRNGANMRTASVVAGVEAAKADKSGNARKFISAALQRPDEPGEALAYAKFRGYKVSGGLKRGIADAVTRLYSERSLLKYDGQPKDYRFGDVIELTHPTPKDPAQGDLFKYAIDRRHKRDNSVPESLSLLAANKTLLATPLESRKTVIISGIDLGNFGMTWESVAGFLQGPMDAAAWEAIIPAMGSMALTRNLRNFDEAGVSDAVAKKVADKIADPAEVVKSRQFPFRYYAAYKNAPSLRWAWALQQGLNESLKNVPELGGNTLILVDRSPSMWWQNLSDHSSMNWADGAALFGTALAVRCANVDLIQFGARNMAVPFSKGESVLKVMERYGQIDGTDIPRAVADNFRNGHHDRVVIVTDEQSSPGVLPSNAYGYRGYESAMRSTKVRDLIPADVPVYIYNFAGYKAGIAPSGYDNVHSFGGLTDASFKQISLIEAGGTNTWPF